MNRTFSLLFFVLFLSACSAGAASPQRTAASTHSATPSATLTLAPSITPLSTASQTPAPPTHTPLPTIPTFTPTFNARTVVTVTPEPKAACPQEDDSIKLNFKFDDHAINADQEILKFLNRGGSMKIIINEFVKNRGNFYFTDVTNDGQPDLIFVGFLLFSDTFYVFSCENGQYAFFSGQGELGIGNSRGEEIYKIVDMNKNGIPEIVAYAGSCTGGGCYHFFIGEWNGKTFVDLGRQPGEDSIYLDGLDESEISIDDLNGDGFLDLRITGGLYDDSFSRWRKETYIYGWDGTYFSQQSVEYALPVYRFQTVQDADRAVLQHQYEKHSSFTRMRFPAVA